MNEFNLKENNSNTLRNHTNLPFFMENRFSEKIEDFNLPKISSPRSKIHNRNLKLKENITSRSYIKPKPRYIETESILSIDKDKDDVDDFFRKTIDNLSIKKYNILNRQLMNHLLSSNNSEIPNDKMLSTCPHFFVKKNPILMTETEKNDPFHFKTAKSYIKNQYDIFFSNKYTDLIYDESKIYNRKNHVKSLIINSIQEIAKLEDFDSKEGNETFTSIYREKFNIKKNNYLELSFSSITIEFIDMESKKKEFELNLPFKFLPIFYYKGFEYFKKLMLKMVQFSNSFDNIFFSIKNSFNILLKEEKIKKVNFKKCCTIDIDDDEDDNEDNNLLEDGDKKKKKKKKVKKKVVENDQPVEINIPSSNNKEIYIKEENKKSIKNDNFYDEYEFCWLTPKRNYKVIIKMPKVSLKNILENVVIYKYIDFELLFFLYEKDFENWDFYLINHLLSFKTFRAKVNTFLSAYHKNKIFNNCPINIFKVNTYTYKNTDLKISYIYTNNDLSNFIKDIECLMIKVTLMKYSGSSDDYLYEYYINLNITQTKKIITCTKIFQKKQMREFLMKFMEIDGNNLKFDFNKFNEINEFEWSKTINEIKRFAFIRSSTKRIISLKNVAHSIKSSKTVVLDAGSTGTTPFFKRTVIDIIDPILSFYSLDDNGKLINGNTAQISEFYFNLYEEPLINWPSKTEKLMQINKSPILNKSKKKFNLQRKTTFKIISSPRAFKDMSNV